MMQNYKIVENSSLSRDRAPKYIVIDKETGEIQTMHKATGTRPYKKLM